MASFRVGQRVRVIRSINHNLGREAIVRVVGEFGLFAWDYGVEVVGHCNPFNQYGLWGANAQDLAPLTDPHEWADSKIAALKKLTDRKIVTTREGVYELAGGESKRISALTK